MVDKVAHYLMNKGGVFYFTRHVPADVRHHYAKGRIVICLKTRSKNSALRASASLAGKLDDFWLQLRLSSMEVPAANLLIIDAQQKVQSSCSVSLTEARDMYCRLKSNGRGKLFFAVADRNVGYVVQCLGDRPVDGYSSADASSFRDWLVEKGLSTSSVKRIFATVRAVINLAIREHGLNCSNPFANTFLPQDERPKRQAIALIDVRRIQADCLRIRDERRLLIALLSDTGMRLSEALGLVQDDIHLDHEHPYIDLKPHKWRSLKTTGSKRQIPLVGAALEAVKVIHKQCTTPFLFPAYTNNTSCNGNSCSAALNKWLKQYGAGYVIHSFRHSFRDRMRNRGIQSEVIDRLGGWSTQSVGQGYGMGYSLEFLTDQMRAALE